MTKYHAIRTNGFASKKESARYQELLLLQKGGQITDLELQPVFPIIVNGTIVCRYRADFVYRENGTRIVEDVKGVKTSLYVLKKKLLKACYGIEIFET